MDVTDGIESVRPVRDGETHPLVDLVIDRYTQAKRWRSSGCDLMGASVDTWIERMNRAYNKIHEPDELQQFPWMSAYFGLIQLKVDSTVAWGKNQFLHQRYAPFSLKPTPDADLPEHLELQAKAKFKHQLLTRLIENDADPEMLIDPAFLSFRTEILPQLQEMMRTEKEAARRISYDIASRACARHTRIIKDQLIEGNWADEYGSMLFDQVLYPYGVMAVERGDVIKWTWAGNRIKRAREEGPILRHVPVIRGFHAPDAKSAQTGSGFYEEVIRSKADLYSMRSSRFAFADEIDAVIQAMSDRESDPGAWIAELSQGTAESAPTETNDGDAITIRMSGEVCGSDLRDAGLMVDDSEVISVTIEVWNGRLLYFDARPFIEGQRGYVSASYTRNNEQAAGISIGMKLFDRQKRLNRLDFFSNVNESMAHGPVIEQLQRAFAGEEGISFAPWTQVYSNPASNGERGLKFHQATPLWRNLYQQFYAQLQLSDHECGIPAFAAYGGGQSMPTLGQTVVHYQAAAKGIQAWLENNDDRVISPVVQVIYHDNLIYLNDPSIEADSRVHAQGALGAVFRDQQGAKITQALPQIINGTQTAGPDGQPIVPTSVAKQAMNQFLGELGLTLPEDGSDPMTDYMTDLGGDSQPGLDIPNVDGRSPGVSALL